MRMCDLILKKKRGEELDTKEIRFMIRGYTDASIPDYQMSAMAMAICFNAFSSSVTASIRSRMDS